MRRLGATALTMLLLVAACGDDSGGLPLGATTTTAAPATTEAPATTAAPATTEAPATTAAPATTEAPATTTTAVYPISTLGPPPLPLPRFLPWGIGFADFGDDMTSVLNTAGLIWGTPSSDTGWFTGPPTSGVFDSGSLGFGYCYGTRARRVSYLGNTITLMFTDSAFYAPGGVDNFIWYGYTGATPLTSGPPFSIDVGTSVADALAMWPGSTVSESELDGDKRFWYIPDGFKGQDRLSAHVTGLSGAHALIDVDGGQGCGWE